MPFRSKAQQRFMESDSSPLTEDQKREWESATDFETLPGKVKRPPAAGKKITPASAGRIRAQVNTILNRR